VKRIALRLLLVLVLLVLALAIYGTTLPRRHVAASAARYHQTREALWAAIADVPGQAAWRSGVDRVERLPDHEGRPAWRIHAGRRSMPLVVTESEAPRWLVTTTPPDADLPFGGSWAWQISAADGASVVTIIEDGEIHNPIFRGMTALYFGYHATMDAYLVDLGRRFGEEVTPRPVPQPAPPAAPVR
jgi:hypothetical protein